MWPEVAGVPTTELSAVYIDIETKTPGSELTLCGTPCGSGARR